MRKSLRETGCGLAPAKKQNANRSDGGLFEDEPLAKAED
jgi:hypothetical protein